MKKSILMLLVVPFLSFAQSDSDTKYIASANNSVSSISVKRPTIDFNKAAVLNKYIGHYKSELINGLEFKLFLEGDKLYCLKKGELNKVEISKVGPSEFRVKGRKFQVQFLEDSDGVQFMMFAKDEVNWLEKVN